MSIRTPSRKRRPPSIRHIHRSDHPGRSTHGWLVQVQRAKRVAAKLFSDAVWGGKRKALEAARAWRDQRIDPLGEYTHALWMRNVLRRNNRSGIVGVARYARSPRKDGRLTGQAYWLAAWVDEHGASRKRKFSVKRWGERGAKQKAVEAREQGVRRAAAIRMELA